MDKNINVEIIKMLLEIEPTLGERVIQSAITHLRQVFPTYEITILVREPGVEREMIGTTDKMPEIMAALARIQAKDPDGRDSAL